ncbi:MAG: N-(5'-phosphoribosyl)anthranilate isomerase [Roseovarius sp.]|uniref:N-(5'-phosphoribosyl)anthranilate isomerase n=1 Tax=Roseovarius sp. TaxID=1486281 RepID=UPI0032ECF7BC
MAVMTWPPDHLSPETWLAQFLDSPEARRGGVVKRQIRDVERIAGRDLFLYEVERRGFQVIENGRHFVVFCNSMPLRRVQGPRDFQIPWPSRLQAAWNAVSKPR